METQLPLFQQHCEKEAADRTHSAVVAMDETFLGDEMIMVLLDLSSGYLILEELSHDRRFDTWFEKAIPRLKALGIEVSHAVSDRAKTLIMLAIYGFECAFGADVFNAQQNVGRWLVRHWAGGTNARKANWKRPKRCCNRNPTTTLPSW